jgi:LPS sulfotransferase NodH
MCKRQKEHVLVTKKRFLVVGHPRSGSTFLIQRLARAVGADTPFVNHEELFNVYERLFNGLTLQLDGSSEVGMLQAFLARSTKRIAGLKTIPSFHREWNDIVNIVDLQFITISRRDVLSSIASMLLSEKTHCWEKSAREQLEGQKRQFSEWFRDRRHQEMVLGEMLNRFLFSLRALEQLNARSSTISLYCEDLAGGRFESKQINEYFEQSIVLRGFKSATNYRECFEDADLFRDTVIAFLRSVLQHDSFVPRLIQDLMTES